jgi:hypothetical protein
MITPCHTMDHTGDISRSRQGISIVVIQSKDILPYIQMFCSAQELLLSYSQSIGQDPETTR